MKERNKNDDDTRVVNLNKDSHDEFHNFCIALEKKKLILFD